MIHATWFRLSGAEALSLLHDYLCLLEMRRIHQRCGPDMPEVVNPRSTFNMNDPAAAVTVALRIPGTWSHPKELVERLPAGFRLTGEELTLPDGTKIDFRAAKADNPFAGIFP